MPSVTVLPSPNGLPIASTTSPTCRLSVLANVIAGKPSPSALSTARSDSGSVPRTCAVKTAAVRQHELDVVGALDHVVIGEHVAFGRHDHAGAEARLPLRLAAVEFREVAAKQRIVGERIARAHILARVDVDDGGHRFLRGIRVTRDARCRPTGVAVSCVTITLPARPFTRGSRSGRSVATTKSAARHSVQACAKRSQNLRSMAKV